MNKIGKIITDLKRDKVRWEREDGWIPHDIYTELKKIKHCQKCKAEGRLQIHHKLPVSKGGKSERSNLIVLCRDCHRIADSEGLR